MNSCTCNVVVVLGRAEIFNIMNVWESRARFNSTLDDFSTLLSITLSCQM